MFSANKSNTTPRGSVIWGNWTNFGHLHVQEESTVHELNESKRISEAGDVTNQILNRQGSVLLY
jgi:hypothetical protein